MRDLSVQRPAPPGPAEPFSLGPDDASRVALARWFGEYGDLCRVPAGRDGAESWVLHNPEDIRRVLVSNHRNYTKGVGLDRVKILLGNGIMVSEGAFWARQRRMIQPCFKSAVLGNFADLIRNENLGAATTWAQAAQRGEAVEMTAVTSALTLSIVLKSIFGVDLAAITERHGDPFELITAEPERNLAFAARFRGLTKVVAQAMAQRREQERNEPDFLGMLMAARGRDNNEPMTDKALIDEVLTLIVAGHETTASVLAWLWYLLAIHPDVARRLYVEVDSIDEQSFDARNTEHAPYTTQVIREAMRLYPPGWLLSRRALRADSLGGYPVAAGSHVFICPYLLHRHPRYWDAPAAFRPERFVDGLGTLQRFAYIPFSAGPRHCVGESFAMMEMLMHVVVMARRFAFTTVGDDVPVIESHINLRAANGIQLKLETR